MLYLRVLDLSILIHVIVVKLFSLFPLNSLHHLEQPVQ